MNNELKTIPIPGGNMTLNRHISDEAFSYVCNKANEYADRIAALLDVGENRSEAMTLLEYGFILLVLGRMGYLEQFQTTSAIIISYNLVADIALNEDECAVYKIPIENDDNAVRTVTFRNGR